MPLRAFITTGMSTANHASITNYKAHRASKKVVGKMRCFACVVNRLHLKY